MTTPVAKEGRPMPIHESVGANAEKKLSLDAVYHLLQNKRRRRIIQYLVGVDGAVTRDEIVEKIAVMENPTDRERVGSQARQRVYVALHQIHLPKLDDANVLDYGPDRGTVTPQASLERLNLILENTARAAAVEEIPGSEFNAGKASALALVGVVPGLILGVLLGNLRSTLTSERILLAGAIALLIVGAIAALGKW